MIKNGYTKQEILAQLAAMNAPRNGIVLMHSALRLVGHVEGDGQGLLDTLIEYFTAEGGLFCVPAHTWANLKKEFVLDMTDPKTCLGAFPDLATADGRGVRSENPTHSMVVFGDRAKAEAFVQGELDLPSGTCPASCYGKIYRAGGHILLVGVSQIRNTYLHCVEEMIGQQNRLSPEPREVKIKRASGEVVTRSIRTHKTDFTKDVSLRFSKYEMPFRYHGAITDAFLGNAPTQLCDAVKMKEVMELIFRRSEGKDPLEDEWLIPPTLYC